MAAAFGPGAIACTRSPEDWIPTRIENWRRPVYAEMALAGVTWVGEFQRAPCAGRKVVRGPQRDGPRTARGRRPAGIRLTLLDTCYLTGGIGEPLSAVQRRFGDGDAAQWAERVAALEPGPTSRIGMAIHSVRAVPADQVATVVAASSGRPLHVHLSEQRAENEECLAAYAATPTQLLQDHGALGPATTAVHATHLTGDDVSLLGGGGATACFCPTTESDLADGIGPAKALHDAGSPLALGSTSTPSWTCSRRLGRWRCTSASTTGQRGRFAPDELIGALTRAGHSSLGWPEAGRIEVGAPCDLVAVRLDTPRTAGVDPAQVVLRGHERGHRHGRRRRTMAGAGRPTSSGRRRQASE